MPTYSKKLNIEGFNIKHFKSIRVLRSIETALGSQGASGLQCCLCRSSPHIQIVDLEEHLRIVHFVTPFWNNLARWTLFSKLSGKVYLTFWGQFESCREKIWRLRTYVCTPKRLFVIYIVTPIYTLLCCVVLTCVLLVVLCSVLVQSVNNSFFLLRPPDTLVPEAYVLLQMFFYSPTSELRRPIAVKICHMIEIWVFFIMQVQKFGGPSPKKLGAKTCKIRRYFRQLQTSIANISGTAQDIQNRKEIYSPAIPPAFHEKTQMNFGPLTTENCMWVWMHPNCIFRETIFRPLGDAGPSNFNTH